jgi:hypothetical protein
MWWDEVVDKFNLCGKCAKEVKHDLEQAKKAISDHIGLP